MGIFCMGANNSSWGVHYSVLCNSKVSSQASLDNSPKSIGMPAASPQLPSSSGRPQSPPFPPQPPDWCFRCVMEAPVGGSAGAVTPP
eukprot:322384-Alexandrium_andersonii.AAC.1